MAGQVSLKDYRGKWVVLYFYPKDFTSGCTMEAKNFQRDLAKYEQAGRSRSRRERRYGAIAQRFLREGRDSISNCWPIPTRKSRPNMDR